MAQTYLQHAANVLGVLTGPMVVLGLDVRQPDRMLVIKAGALLSMDEASSWGALSFSSRYLFLRKAFGCTKDAIPNNTVTLCTDPTRTLAPHAAIDRTDRQPVRNW